MRVVQFKKGRKVKMPTRILRDYTDSAAFDGLSAEGERLFIRLLMKADDFGRFHANPKLVKALCFPLAEDLRTNTVSAWLAELSDRELVFCYRSGAGEYLALPKFGQRTRAEKSKFPPPEGEPPEWMPQTSARTLRTTVSTPPTTARVFGDVVEDGGECGAPAPLPRGCGKRKPQGWPSTEPQAREMAEQAGVNADLAATFWHHFDGMGYWPQGSFVSAMKAKQGFKDQDLADKERLAPKTVRAGMVDKAGTIWTTTG
jgi:hypothetical protein